MACYQEDEASNLILMIHYLLLKSYGNNIIKSNIQNPRELNLISIDYAILNINNLLNGEKTYQAIIKSRFAPCNIIVNN